MYGGLPEAKAHQMLAAQHTHTHTNNEKIVLFHAVISPDQQLVCTSTETYWVRVCEQICAGDTEWLVSGQSVN